MNSNDIEKRDILIKFIKLEVAYLKRQVNLCETTANELLFETAEFQTSRLATTAIICNKIQLYKWDHIYIILYKIIAKKKTDMMVQTVIRFILAEMARIDKEVLANVNDITNDTSVEETIAQNKQK